MRHTRQREIIFQELAKSRDHPSADEVYARVKRRLPRISLATVYRNLELFASEGLIRKMNAVGAQMRFDASVMEHDHVVCIRCGKVCDIDVEKPGSLESRIMKKTGYRFLERRVSYLGICPECLSRKKGASR